MFYTGTLAFTEETLILVNDEFFDKDGFFIDEGESFDIRLDGVWMTGNYEINPPRIVFKNGSFCGLLSGMIARTA